MGLDQGVHVETPRRQPVPVGGQPARVGFDEADQLGVLAVVSRDRAEVQLGPVAVPTTM
jgi:hypothetical protein